MSEARIKLVRQGRTLKGSSELQKQGKDYYFAEVFFHPARRKWTLSVHVQDSKILVRDSLGVKSLLMEHGDDLEALLRRHRIFNTDFKGVRIALDYSEEDVLDLKNSPQED